jgi:hypothetical protein
MGLPATSMGLPIRMLLDRIPGVYDKEHDVVGSTGPMLTTPASESSAGTSRPRGSHGRRYAHRAVLRFHAPSATFLWWSIHHEGHGMTKRQRGEGLTPSERSLRARLAVHTSWANTRDRSARTAPGRRAAMERFERGVDPDGSLSPAERSRRAEQAMRAHMARLALKSAKVRRRRRAP